MIRLHLHAVLALDDRHLREPPHEIRHHTRVAGGQVGDENKGNAGIGGHMGEKLLEGFQTAGGGVHPDDGEICCRRFFLIFHLSRSHFTRIFEPLNPEDVGDFSGNEPVSRKGVDRTLENKALHVKTFLPCGRELH